MGQTGILIAFTQQFSVLRHRQTAHLFATHQTGGNCHIGICLHGLHLTSHHVPHYGAFQISVRCQAAGDDIPVRQDAAEAEELARELCALNRERQAVEQDIFSQALELTEAMPRVFAEKAETETSN